MSSGGHGRGGSDDASKKGSVRAARQRLEESLKTPRQGPPRTTPSPKPHPLVSQFSVDRDDDNGHATSSQHATQFHPPVTHWPFADDGPPSSPDSPPRLSTPEKSKNANYVPSSIDPSRLVPPHPKSKGHAHKSSGEWQHDDDLLSPSFPSSSSRPITQSSRGSTGSSLGSIPDFPIVPSVANNRKSPNLGPPPSARRGPSSYYSQHSIVPPIVEESEGTRSHVGSFASSNVIPDRQDFFFEDPTPSEDERNEGDDEGDGQRSSEHSRNSSRHEEQNMLVRQASIGRRTKPSLTTIQSADSLSTLREEDRTSPILAKKPSLKQQRAAGNPLRMNSTERMRASPAMSLSSGTGLLDASSSSDSLDNTARPQQNTKAMGKVGPTPNRSRSPLAAEAMSLDPVLASLEKEAQMDSGRARGGPPNSLANRIGGRRPPRLNVDAVKEAETRGSLTSLPDLIKRATRLAANLDHGRTASRLGLDFWDNAGLQKEAGAPRDRSGSLTDILASFPPPGLATPTGERTPTRMASGWPSNLREGEVYSPDGMTEKSDGRRRCCGMPRWVFVLVMILLFLLIAAAVVVPVILLVVIPRQNENATGAQGSSRLAVCPEEATCQNGGVSVLTADQLCGCICVGGFTGERCAVPVGAACVSEEVEGVGNATMGSAIPRLLEGAASNFSIPLNESLILSEFSSQRLSCAIENALVRFNGLIEKRSLPIIVDVPDAPLEIAPRDPMVTPAPIAKRQNDEQNGDAVTSDGIIFEDGPETDAPRPTPVSSRPPRESSTRRPTPTRPAEEEPSSTPVGPPSNNNATMVDFARVSVLFVFQISRSLEAASLAQDSLQSFLFTPEENMREQARNLTLGNRFIVDLIDLTFTSNDGLIYGNGYTNSTS